MTVIGRTVRALQYNDDARVCDALGNTTQGYRTVKPGDTGTVVSTDEDYYTTVYPPLEGDLKSRYRRIRHRKHNEGKTWDFVQTSPTATLTIEQQGVMELFLASSTETIDGTVPQVKYGKVIVWQGEPVDATDKTEDEVTTEALEVAQDKITEVVKKQFT